MNSFVSSLLKGLSSGMNYYGQNYLPYEQQKKQAGIDAEERAFQNWLKSQYLGLAHEGHDLDVDKFKTTSDLNQDKFKTTSDLNQDKFEQTKKEFEERMGLSRDRLALDTDKFGLTKRKTAFDEDVTNKQVAIQEAKETREQILFDIMQNMDPDDFKSLPPKTQAALIEAAGKASIESGDEKTWEGTIRNKPKHTTEDYLSGAYPNWNANQKDDTISLNDANPYDASEDMQTQAITEMVRTQREQAVLYEVEKWLKDNITNWNSLSDMKKRELIQEKSKDWRM